MGQQRPDRSNVLVGQRHRCHVGVAAAEQSSQPDVGVDGLALGRQDRRAGTMDEQRSQVDIAAFADAKERRLAAAGMLPRYQPEPG